MGAFDNYDDWLKSQQAPRPGGAFANYPAQPQAAPAPAAASSPVSPSSASPPAANPNLTYLPDWMNNWNRAMQDAFTFGGADRAQALLAGTDVAKQRAMTQAAREALGPIGSLSADVAGYATGAGEIGAAGKIGGAAAPYLARLPFTGAGKWLGGVLGSGAEGAAAGALGAAGHGEDVTQGAEWGGGLGALSGTLGGVVGRGGTLPAARSATDIKADMQAAYAPLDAMVFHGPSQIGPALDRVQRGMSSYEGDLAKSTMAQVQKLRDQNLVTGSDLQSAQQRFGKIAAAPGASVEDKNFAPKFSAAINDIMENTTPYGRNLTPGQGMNLMPGGAWSPGAGFGPGEAARARDIGDKFYGQLQDLNRLGDWQANTAVPGGPTVGSQASQYLRSDAGKRYAPPGSPQYDAFSDLAARSAPPPSLWPTAFDLRHAASPLMGAGVGLGLGIEQHHDPATIAEETILGGLGGFGLHRVGPYAYSRLVSQPALARAIDAARVTASTGQYQPPVFPVAKVRDALRAAIFGRGAGGAY